MKKVLVCGAGGFIGGHLVRRLLDDGCMVKSVDIKSLSHWHQVHNKERVFEMGYTDLREPFYFSKRYDEVYNLAADMGGMGFIENNKAACMLSVLINTNLIRQAERSNCGRFFFSSSACVYNAGKQTCADVTPLKEEDAYPAMPEDGYGWEKLFSERMCRHFYEDYGLETRVARYHNVYGPNGTWHGGREKVPAAICRKVAQAVISGIHEIEIWGDGEQTRSFMYIDDCIDGTIRLMRSDCCYPMNIGSAELVSINRLVSIVEEIAGVTLDRKYNLGAPKGVRGRSSDNTLCRAVLGWEPSISLRSGIERTYAWIYDQVKANS